MVPDAREFLGQPLQGRAIGRRRRRELGGERGQARLELVDSGQGRIPALFERRRHQPVLGLDGVVLPLRALGLVARLAQLQRQGLAGRRVLVSDRLGAAAAPPRSPRAGAPGESRARSPRPRGGRRSRCSGRAVIDGRPLAVVARDVSADA